MATNISKSKGPVANRTSGRKATFSTAKDAKMLVRFDRSSKALVQRAAAACGLSVSDYIRTRIVPLARQDIADADTGMLLLPREDQIAFWQALQHPPIPTPAQRRLGERIQLVM